MKSPTVERKGFLPIRTTRGDRLFIGLLAAAWVNLAFLGLGGKAAEWFSLDGPPSVGSASWPRCCCWPSS